MRRYMKNTIRSVLFSILFIPYFAFSANDRDVIINEVSWMGTTNSSYDEWIELYNTTSDSIDLNGWTLKSTDGTPNISLSGTIQAYGYFLLERTDDTSVPGITADKIYTGSMTNGGENIELTDDSNLLIDSVSTWYAGINTSKTTMERINPQSIGDQSTNWGNAISSYAVGYGTPGAINSVFSDGQGSSSDCTYPQNLEVTSINIGQGDATLIATKTKILLADAGESYWNSHNDADKIAAVIHDKYGESCNTIDYIVISHFHLDHIGYIQSQDDANGDIINENGEPLVEGDNMLSPVFKAGLAYLIEVAGFSVGETILRDYITHNPNKAVAAGGSKTYRNWRAYLASPNGQASFNPTIAVLGDSQVDMGTVQGIPVIIDIVALDGATPDNASGCDPATYFGGSQNILRGDRSGYAVTPSENDVSLAFILSYGDFQAFVGGDLSGANYSSGFGSRYHDVETCLANDQTVQNKYGNHLEIMRINHHGSKHSTNQAFIDAFSPVVSVFSVGDNNLFGHINLPVLDRVLAKSIGENSGAVFTTESGADFSSSSDACHSTNSSWCAEIADGEYPGVTESNEIDDANIQIIVQADGSYTVQGDLSNIPLEYQSN